MNKRSSDPKVKKTFVRNCELKVRPTTSSQVVHDVDESCPREAPSFAPKEDVLSHPMLCSSDALANYLSDVKKSVPPPLSSEDLNVDRGKLSVQMTKKLNFHFNDRMYHNLIELNASFDSLKVNKKDRKPIPALKKDLEPNIEDFCHDEKEFDSPPKIPVVKPKFNPIRNVEDGSLHRLVSSFEVL